MAKPKAGQLRVDGFGGSRATGYGETQSWPAAGRWIWWGLVVNMDYRFPKDLYDLGDRFWFQNLWALSGGYFADFAYRPFAQNIPATPAVGRRIELVGVSGQYGLQIP